MATVAVQFLTDRGDNINPTAPSVQTPVTFGGAYVPQVFAYRLKGGIWDQTVMRGYVFVADPATFQPGVPRTTVYPKLQ